MNSLRKTARAFLGVTLMALVACGTVSAIPTPKDTAVSWDAYTDTSATGFYLYYALESESPRVYDNTRRVQIPRVSPQTDAVIATLINGAKGSLCFKLTAHDATLKESAFSNEACGWFGMGNPQNLQRK